MEVILYYTRELQQDGCENRSVQHGEYVGYASNPLHGDLSLPVLVDVRIGRTVGLRNARRHSGFQLCRNGFELRRWPTEVVDFYDTKEVLRTYVPEVEALVGAAVASAGTRSVRAVIVWDLCLRDSQLKNELQEDVSAAVPGGDSGAAMRSLDHLAPVSTVHVDFHGPRDVQDRFLQRCNKPIDTLSSCMSADFSSKGITSADLHRRIAAQERVASINVWRSIDAVHPVRRDPLALCDPRTVQPAEKVPFLIDCPDVRLVEAHVMPDHSDAHQWYCFPEMERDECLLFVSGDTAELWPSVPHTAFSDPRTTAGDPPRRSIEARAFVLFD